MEVLGQLVAFSFLGLMISIVVSLYFLRGKKPLIAFILCLGGMFGGLLGAMMYVFLTGGLEESPFMSIPSVILAFLVCFILMKLFGVKIELKHRKKPLISTTMSSLFVFFILIAILLLTMYPIDTSSMKTSTDEMNAPSRITTTGVTDISEDMLSIASLGNYNSDNIVINRFDIAYVNFPKILDNPAAGDYITFEAHFAVSGNPWVKPYIKMAVFQDTNANGVLDSGDAFWSDSLYKSVLGGTSEGANWRSHCVYDSSSAPLQQLNLVSVSGKALLMPIYYASAWGTQWQNDNGKTFANTPENYVSPRDQVSWQLGSGGSVTLKESGTITYVQINVGSEGVVKGKIYIPDGATGSQGVIIQAFDANQGTDPFNPDAVPLASYVKAFQIGGGPGPGAPTITISVASWTILGLLGASTFIGAAIAASRIKSLTLFL